MTAEQLERLHKVIWIDPERMGGEPCFTGSRVPVQTLIDHLEDERVIEYFREGFPGVTREQVVEFLELAQEFLVECVSSSMSASTRA